MAGKSIFCIMHRVFRLYHSLQNGKTSISFEGLWGQRRNCWWLGGCTLCEGLFIGLVYLLIFHVSEDSSCALSIVCNKDPVKGWVDPAIWDFGTYLLYEFSLWIFIELSCTLLRNINTWAWSGSIISLRGVGNHIQFSMTSYKSEKFNF